MITIIDYGAGNIGSIQNMIKRMGGECIISNCPDEISNAKKLILPGVGSFDHGMKNLKKSNLIEILKKKVLEHNTPILGICLGMQLMTLCSEEGDEPGLGFINAKVKKFKTQNYKLKIPHMGWNKITLSKSSKLFNDLFIETVEQKFYFVHSYYVECTNSIDVLATTNYIHEFTSAFEKNNIMGMQFHPEKSHKFGMEVFKNFIQI
tara:strand:+ start:474 stop:1091 length:618 start_codon:yes stop_codon:yes gene_type:complete